MTNVTIAAAPRLRAGARFGAFLTAPQDAHRCIGTVTPCNVKPSSAPKRLMRVCLEAWHGRWLFTSGAPHARDLTAIEPPAAGQRECRVIRRSRALRPAL